MSDVRAIVCQKCGEGMLGSGAYYNGASMSYDVLLSGAGKVNSVDEGTWRSLLASLDFRMRTGLITTRNIRDRIWLAVGVLLGRLG